MIDLCLFCDSKSENRDRGQMEPPVVMPNDGDESGMGGRSAARAAGAGAGSRRAGVAKRSAIAGPNPPNPPNPPPISGKRREREEEPVRGIMEEGEREPAQLQQQGKKQKLTEVKVKPPIDEEEVELVKKKIKKLTILLNLQDKNSPDYFATLLALSELLHDFWGGYRPDGGGEEINNMILETLFRVHLGGDPGTAAYNGWYGTLPVEIKARSLAIINKAGELMTILYGGRSITKSEVEDKTIYAFRNMHPKLSPHSPNARLTFDDIFSGEENPANPGKLSTATIDKLIALRDQYESLSFDPGNHTIKGLTESQKVKVRTAYRIFFSGLRDKSVETLLLILTFDAAGQATTKLFLGDPYVRALVMPSNIADSATSSVKKLGKDPNLFVFLDGEDIYARNPMTRSLFHIVFENRNFSEKNPFDFEYVVKYSNNGGRNWEKLCSASFNKNTTQGPSLNTLMENHILAYTRREFRFQGTNGCLDIARQIPTGIHETIATLVRNGFSLFTAAKADGDEKQVKQADKVAKLIKDGRLCSDGTIIEVGQSCPQGVSIVPPSAIVVVVSLDRQTILQGTLEDDICCIRHQADNLTAHRTKKVMTADELALYVAERDKKYFKENAQFFMNMVANLGQILDSFVQNPVRELPGLTQSAIKLLHRRRHSDIGAQLLNIKAIWTTNNGDFEINSRSISALLASENPPTEEINTAAAYIRSRFELFTNSVVSMDGIVAIMNLTGPFDSSKNYPFLNYFPETYKGLDNLMASAIEAANKTRAPRLPEDPMLDLYVSDGYLSTLDDIFSTFKNTTAVDELKAAFKLPGGAEVVAARQVVADFMKLVKRRKNAESEVERRPLSDQEARDLPGANAATVGIRDALKGYLSTLNSVALPLLQQGGGGGGGDERNMRGPAAAGPFGAPVAGPFGAAAAAAPSPFGVAPAGASPFGAPVAVPFGAAAAAPAAAPNPFAGFDITSTMAATEAARALIVNKAYIVSSIAYDASMFFTRNILESNPLVTSVAELKTKFDEFDLDKIRKELLARFNKEFNVTDFTRDNTLNYVKILLDPFDPRAVSETGLREFHPYTRLAALPVYNYYDILFNGLLTLAYLSELFEDRIGRRKSAIITILGRPPDSIITKYKNLNNITADAWRDLSRILDSIFIGVTKGRISRDARSLWGGARKTIRNKRKTRHSKKYNRTTRRADRKQRLTKRRR